MNHIASSKELMEQIENMNRNHSVIQFSITRKGKFTLVLQEETEQSIEEDVKENPQLKQMIRESQREYEEGKGMSTDEMLKFFSEKDFE